MSTNERCENCGDPNALMVGSIDGQGVIEAAAHILCIACHESSAWQAPEQVFIEDDAAPMAA